MDSRMLVYLWRGLPYFSQTGPKVSKIIVTSCLCSTKRNQIKLAVTQTLGIIILTTSWPRTRSLLLMQMCQGQSLTLMRACGTFSWIIIGWKLLIIATIAYIQICTLQNTGAINLWGFLLLPPDSQRKYMHSPFPHGSLQPATCREPCVFDGFGRRSRTRDFLIL